MSESSLREAIARVIFRGQWQDPESEFAKQKWVKFKELYLADADAVIAVLADLPDDVIEQAADGIYDRAYGQELPEAPIDLARAAFEAAFGSEPL